MAIIKCKMCGGDIELAADKTFGTCEFCGSTMTLPKIDDDQRAAAFNRGNHFRRIGEFDKALAVYEQIIGGDDTDAEAHWCCALCRFGIEYVEDPDTYEYLPTCHRVSFDSFLEDVDYKAALEYSAGITRRQYMKDGAKIAEVQRGILATSQNAEPYDVFICYKESDDNGGRTRDSLLAQDIYYQLIEQGRKVFFSRITLEDVAGTQYEPYIFAALNSAKVMIVVGTKPEYLHAVWVKNEWSRFLAMMKKDRSKLLLPCYRDMDPYDMPEQLSVLQSYDMSRIGFIQDLIRGVAKVLDVEKTPSTVKETVVVQQSAAPASNTAPLLKRAFLFLEDGDWNSANEYCEKVLDMDPECAQAYLGKLMAELRISRQPDLKNQAKPFGNNNNYQKAIRFADTELKNTLAGYITHIETRNEYARKDAILADAKEKMGLQSIRGYMAAMALFQSIPGWKNADESILICERRIEEIKAKAEADRLERQQKQELTRAKAVARSKKIGKVVGISAAIICVMIVCAVILNIVLTPKVEYAVGNYVTLGTYEQDKNIANGKEPIEWLILDVKDGKMLLISKYILDGQCVDKDEGATAWLHSSLYGWLKNSFLTSAFTIEERAMISSINLLTTDEANRYFESDSARVCYPTPFAQERSLPRGACPWWLQTDGKIWGYHVVVTGTGEVFEFGEKNRENYGVRPAIWVDTSNSDASKYIAKCETANTTTGIETDEIDFVSILSEYINQGLSNQDGKVNEYITFGAYEQDGNISNGKEPIEWLILDKQDGKVLVISKYVLDCQTFGGNTWSTCSLRRWLNNNFLVTAFTDAERELISIATVKADAVTYHFSDGKSETRDPGKDTQDSLFFLSASEVNEYFDSILDRTCQATEYAKAQGAYVSNHTGNSWWWLRSSVPSGSASIVYDHGGYETWGNDEGNARGIRPVMWLELGE